MGVKFKYNNKFKKAQQLQFSLVFIVKEMSAAKFATRYTIITFQNFLENVCTQSFCMAVKYGHARRWKTTASIFKIDLRCQSYNPNLHGAWGSGKISDRN